MSRSRGRGHRSYQRARARVLARSTICWLCGKDGADTVDHVVPLELGGDLAAEANLRPAHGACNSSRGHHPPRSATVRSRAW